MSDMKNGVYCLEKRNYNILCKTMTTLVPETQHDAESNTDVLLNQDQFNDTPIITESSINILLYI